MTIPSLRLPLSAEKLDAAMGARGMIPLAKIHKPMLFGLHAGVHDEDGLIQWLRMKDREYGGMKGSKRERDPEMEAWITGKAAVFGSVARALNEGRELDEIHYWASRFSDAAQKVQIRLQLDNFKLDCPRGERIFGMGSAWSEVRQHFDHVYGPFRHNDLREMNAEVDSDFSKDVEIEF